MSYNVWLEADLGGPEMTRITYDSWNYTSNCAPMWRAAGLDLGECYGLDAGVVAESIGAALVVLRQDPAQFKAMNPVGGWGSYDTAVPALEELMAMCNSAPKAIVKVSQ